jgi:hypothetical protein
MTETFPLYNSLLAMVPPTSPDLTPEEKEEFLALFREISSQNVFNTLFALIHAYNTDHNPNAITGGPVVPTESSHQLYGSKKLKSGIKFNLEDIPFPLKHILLVFMKMHKNKLEEDSVRKN